MTFCAYQASQAGSQTIDQQFNECLVAIVKVDIQEHDGAMLAPALTGGKQVRRVCLQSWKERVQKLSRQSLGMAGKP